jgi:hypothetical protein
MNSDRPEVPTRVDLAEAHLRLQNLFEEISRRLSPREWTPAEVLETFNRLRDELLEHFRHEELGGYFGDAVELAPRLKARADVLLQQHPDLANHLDRLRMLAERGRSTEIWWHAVTEEYASFYDAFDRHERSETELLQEVYTQDVRNED